LYHGPEIIDMLRLALLRFDCVFIPAEHPAELQYFPLAEGRQARGVPGFPKLAIRTSKAYRSGFS
jgi:hypothetical protein